MTSLKRPVVCVQGLGFVGAAMAVAVACAKGEDGAPLYDVIGVDLPTEAGAARIVSLNKGVFPFENTDVSLAAALAEAARNGNFTALSDPAAFERADVIIVDVNLDVADDQGVAVCDFSGFEAAIRSIGAHARQGALVIVETTVPPGACRNIVAPILREECARRGLPADALFLAHSYERVMPGPGYLASITNFWRVYAADDEASAARCEAFLSSIVNIEAYPLRRLSSTTASETAKVLENSYRAVNIAFVEEWGRFAEQMGVNLFEVIDAVRVRPTHNNIRQPGLGVGGYCLTKDPLFPEVSARRFLPDASLSFPFNRLGMATNKAMPLHSVERLLDGLNGASGKRVLMMGAAYRSDVGDTRFSAAELFYNGLRAAGAEVLCHDPFVAEWSETSAPMLSTPPSVEGVDAIAFCVGHTAFRGLDMAEWLGPFRPLVYDCDNCLSDAQVRQLKEMGCPLLSTGRGDLSL